MSEDRETTRETEDKEKRGKKTFWQFIGFALVGVSNTFISEVGYAILIYFGMHYIPASFISFSLSVVNAYYWNSRHVFNSQINRSEKGFRVTMKRFGKTYIAYFGGYVAHALLLAFWVEIVKLSQYMSVPSEWFIGMGIEKFTPDFLGELLAAVLNLIITVPMNFLLNKFWVYKKKKSTTKVESNNEQSPETDNNQK